MSNFLYEYIRTFIRVNFLIRIYSDIHSCRKSYECHTLTWIIKPSIPRLSNLDYHTWIVKPSIPRLSNLVYLDYHTQYTWIVKPSIPRLLYLDYETKYTSIIIPNIPGLSYLVYLDYHALMMMIDDNICTPYQTNVHAKYHIGRNNEAISYQCWLKLILTETNGLRNLSYQQVQTRPHCQRKPLGKVC